MNHHADQRTKNDGQYVMQCLPQMKIALRPKGFDQVVIE